MHISVASSPVTHGEPTELGMLKAALLYADSVELLSPASNMYLEAAGMLELGPRERLELLVQVAPALEPDADLSQLLSTYDYGGRKLRRQLNKKIDKEWKALEGRILDFLGKTGTSEVVRAMSSGLLSVHAFEFNTEMPGEATTDDNDIARQYTDAVLSTLLDSSTLPLLDAPTNHLISLGVREGVFHVGERDAVRGNPIALANSLFSRLPTFTAIPMDEVLGLRKELAKPLARFRAAVSELARTLENPQWDDEFEAEVERIVVEKVQPAILELEELAQSNSFLRKLLDEVMRDKLALLATLGLSFEAMSTLSSLLRGEVPSSPGALSLGEAAPLASSAWKAYKSRSRTASELENSQFFLYYELKRRFAE